MPRAHCGRTRPIGRTSRPGVSRAHCSFDAMPAAPVTVGAYLAAAGLGYALPTLRRRVAAIARAHRIAKHPLDTKHPAIRETLRGIARMHGEPARRSVALTTSDIKRLVEVCGDDLAGLRDRALILLGFAGALRRSELVGIDVEHVRSAPGGLRLLIPRSKTDAAGEGAEIGIVRGAQPETCPVRALRAWLRAAEVTDGPVFRRVTWWNTIEGKRLHPDAVRQILLRVRLESQTERASRLASSMTQAAWRKAVEERWWLQNPWRGAAAGRLTQAKNRSDDPTARQQFEANLIGQLADNLH